MSKVAREGNHSSNSHEHWIRTVTPDWVVGTCKVSLNVIRLLTFAILTVFCPNLARAGSSKIKTRYSRTCYRRENGATAIPLYSDTY